MLRSILAITISLCVSGLSRPATPAAPPAQPLRNPAAQIRTVFNAKQVAGWSSQQVDKKPSLTSPVIQAPAGYELNHHRITVDYRGNGTVEVSLAHHTTARLDQAIAKRHLHSPFKRVTSGKEITVVSRYKGERSVWLLVRTEGQVQIDRITHACWRGKGTLYGHSAKVFRFAGSILPYRIRYPRDYDPAKRYPLVISVAGSGSLGKDNVKNMEMVILARHLFTERFNDPQLQCFSIVPQIPANRDIPAPYWPKGPQGRPTQPYHPDWPAVNENGWYVEATLALIQNLLADERLSIDPDRVYYTGFSYGGKACWEFLKAGREVFAGALCGAGWPIGRVGVKPTGLLLKRLKQEVRRYKHIPVRVFVGENDPMMRPGSLAVHEEILAQGGKSSYVQFPKTAHVQAAAKIWANRDNLAYLFEQNRKNNPPAGPDPFPKGVYGGN